MQNAVAAAVRTRLANNKLTFPEVVLIAMHAVELYAKNVAPLQGQQKVETAKAQIPLVIQFALDHGYCDGATGEALRAKLENDVDVIEHMIDVIHSVAVSPALVQVEQAVAQTCCLPVARK